MPETIEAFETFTGPAETLISARLSDDGHSWTPSGNGAFVAHPKLSGTGTCYPTPGPYGLEFLDATEPFDTTNGVVEGIDFTLDVKSIESGDFGPVFATDNGALNVPFWLNSLAQTFSMNNYLYPIPTSAFGIGQINGRLEAHPDGSVMAYREGVLLARLGNGTINTPVAAGLLSVNTAYTAATGTHLTYFAIKTGTRAFAPGTIALLATSSNGANVRAEYPLYGEAPWTKTWKLAVGAGAFAAVDGTNSKVTYNTDVLSLCHLTPGTTYRVKCEWTDAETTVVTSNIVTFTTKPTGEGWTITIEGNSISAGVGSQTHLGLRKDLGSQLQDLYGVDDAPVVYNLGSPGQTTTGIYGSYAGEAHMGSDEKANLSYFHEVGNDLSYNEVLPMQTATGAYAVLHTMLLAMKAALPNPQDRVIAATCIDRTVVNTNDATRTTEGYAFPNDTWSHAQTYVNNALKSSYASDGLLLVDMQATNPDTGGGGLHPTDGGYATMAAALKTVADTYITALPSPDTTAPTFTAKSIPSGGTTVLLPLSEVCTAVGMTAGDFSLSVTRGGVSTAIAVSAAVLASDGLRVTLTVAQVYSSDTSPLLTYTGNSIKDAAETPNALDTFANQAVSNGSTVPAPGPGQVAAPTLDPVGGSYSATQEITVTLPTAGSAGFYTTDGSEPTTDSTPIANNGTIAIGAGTTVLKVFATKAAMTDSDTITATYIVTIPSGGGGGGTQIVHGRLTLKLDTKADSALYLFVGDVTSLRLRLEDERGDDVPFGSGTMTALLTQYGNPVGDEVTCSAPFTTGANVADLLTPSEWTAAKGTYLLTLRRTQDGQIDTFGPLLVSVASR